MGCYAQSVELKPFTFKELSKLDNGYIITENSQIFKAHPNHTIVAANLFSQLTGIGIQEALELPFKKSEYNFSSFDFYCKEMRVVFVWKLGYWGGLTRENRQIMCRLKKNGIYEGTIGEIGEYKTFPLGNKRCETISKFLKDVPNCPLI